MTRRTMFLTAAGSLLLATVGTGVGNAAPIAGTGTIGSCTLIGKATIKPGLVFSGTATPVKTKFSGKLSACAGGTGDGANVIGGTLKATILSNGTNDCLSLSTNGLDPFPATVKWKGAKGTPRLLPTTVNIAATPPGNIVIGAAITITLNGTNAAGGSFVGNNVVASAVTDQTAIDFATLCASPRGLKKFNFTGLNGPSSVSD